MKSRQMLGSAVLCFGVALSGCSSSKTVSRIDPGTTVDLSGNWNDTDSRLVSDEMIHDALTLNSQSRPWLASFMKDHGKNPAVIVGAIRNLTDEHIATAAFVGDIERAFINSGNVRVVATKDERSDVRSERRDQQANASDETVKTFGKELGADYMLIGSINKITDQEGKEKVAFYQVDLNLTDIQSNEKAWSGQTKIKKYIARKPYKP
jgi:uncharacterized protein (TIGR02722 family)